MANNKIQVKRTTVAGRTPNTSDPSNTSYIAPGEFALNMADKVLYTSNGSSLIAVGASQDTITATTGNFNNISTDGGISIGNSTVNASVNSTTLFAGNTSTNVTVNTSVLSVANTTSNVYVNPLTIFVGNSTINATVTLANLTTNVAISRISLTSAGVATVNTVGSHGITSGLQTYLKIADSSKFIFNTNNYLTEDTTFRIATIPSANSVTFNLGTAALGNLKNKNRKISSISRTSGVVSVTTVGEHNLLTGDTVSISGITSKYPMNTTGSNITKVSNTVFTYTNGTSDITTTLTSAFTSIPAYSKTSTAEVLMTVTKSGHGFATNDIVTVSGMSLITLGTAPTSQTFDPNGTGKRITATTSTTFTYSIGSKSLNTTWSSSNPTVSGTVFLSKDETGTTTGSLVYEIITSTAAGGNVSIIVPQGILIRDSVGDKVFRITADGIFVGNTTGGASFTKTGSSTTAKP